MNKIFSTIKNNKYFFIVFLFILISGAVAISRYGLLNDYRLCLYLRDYSIGFCSHCLIGSFIGLFRKVLTVKWITQYCKAVYAFMAFVTAVVINSFFKKAKYENRKALIVSTFVILAMPAGIGYFAVWLGMLDIYWYIFTLLALVCLQNKYLQWLFPLFSFLCLATHYVAAVTFFPVFAAVLMFMISESENKKPLITLFALTVIVSVLSGVYFVFFASNTLKMSESEAFTYLNSKLPVNQESTLFYLFGKTRDGHADGVSGILGTSMSVNLSEFFNKKTLSSLIASFCPYIAAITAVYIIAFRNSDAFGKLTSVLCIAFNSVPFLLSVFSADYLRWFALVALAQAMIILYLVYKGHKAITSGFDRVMNFFVNHPACTALFCYINIIYQIRLA